MFPLLDQLIQDKSVVYNRGPVKPMPRGVLPSAPLGIAQKRILLRRGGALGDVLFSTVVASTIRSQQSRCSITFACSDWIAPLVRRIPEIDNVVSISDARRPEFIKGFDYFIDFTGVLEGNSAAKNTDYFQLHLERAGIEGWPLVMPNFKLPSGSKNYLAIHVGGSNDKKKWPISHWNALIKDLEMRSVRFVLLGDGGDCHPDVSDPQSDLIGSTDIVEACKIVAGAALFVGTDSGLLHFAGMNGVPTFSLWGAFNPLLTIPNYDNASYVSWNIECSPCLELNPKSCRCGFRCMTALKPQMVYTKLWNHSAIAHAVHRENAVISVPAPSHIEMNSNAKYFHAGQSVDKLPEDRGSVDVSIIIPNKNTAKFLPALYDTIDKNTGKVSYEIVLVTDGDAPYKPQVGTEIVLEQTLGYSGANNAAFAVADKGSEFICLLNADVEVEENWLQPLVDFLRMNEDVGIAGSMQHRFNGRIESLGSRWDWSTEHFPHIGYGKIKHPDMDAPCEREMITFSAVLIRRDVWTQVGGLDTIFGAGYWEDSNFCLKARELGWRIFCVPESKVKHHVGGSKSVPRGMRERNQKIFRNRWVYNGLVDKFRHQIGIRHHKNKIVACYIVLNEEEYIQASLESIYDFVDEIVVVEGGNNYAIDAGLCGADKRSTDHTVERIQSYPDPQKKIKLIQGDWATKTDQRNAYADRLRAGDWMFLMDGDEVFFEDGLWRASALMHHFDIIMPGFYLFWNDFYTIGTSVWESFLQTKIVHWREDFKYINHNCPSDSTGKLIVRNPAYKKWRHQGERLYAHYSWVKPVDKLRAKAEYYRHQKGHSPVVSDYMEKVFLAWRTDPKTVEHRFGTHLYGGGETRRFDRAHPDAIAKRIESGEFTWDM